MALDPITSIVDAASTILNKIFPDADAKLKGQLALATQELQAAAQAAVAQADINKIEAQSPHLFVAGWRPAVGWICAFGLLYSFALKPLLSWISVLFNVQVPPVLDTGPLISLLVAMLGVGGMRTFEKVQGVETKATRV